MAHLTQEVQDSQSTYRMAHLTQGPTNMALLTQIAHLTLTSTLLPLSLTSLTRLLALLTLWATPMAHLTHTEPRLRAVKLRPSLSRPWEQRMALLTQTQAMAHLPHSEATATVDQVGGREGALEQDDDQTDSIPNRHGGRARERGGNEDYQPSPPQHPPPGTARTLIDRIIGFLPYLSTLNARQIGTHTWSDQLVPLIWCATQDNTCEQLREALAAADRGHEALTAFRSWWIEQGIHTAEDAVRTLNIIARQVGVRGPPIRRYQYLQAPIQEHLATLSGAEFVVASDLVRAAGKRRTKDRRGTSGTARGRRRGQRYLQESQYRYGNGNLPSRQ